MAAARPPIRRARGGAFVVDLDAVHAGAIGEAMEQTRDLLVDDGDDQGAPGGGTGGEPLDQDDVFEAIVADIASPGDGERPDHPVLRRLLPDAATDEEAAQEFRVATEAGLRRRKAAALTEVLDDLAPLREGRGPVTVPAARVRSWLTGVNDTRLALGSMLGVRQDEDLVSELDDYLADDVTTIGEGERTLRAYRIVVYDILTDLLDRIVRTVSR